MLDIKLGKNYNLAVYLFKMGTIDVPCIDVRLYNENENYRVGVVEYNEDYNETSDPLCVGIYWDSSDKYQEEFTSYGSCFEEIFGDACRINKTVMTDEEVKDFKESLEIADHSPNTYYTLFPNGCILRTTGDCGIDDVSGNMIVLEVQVYDYLEKMFKTVLALELHETVDSNSELVVKGYSVYGVKPHCTATFKNLSVVG